MDSMFAGVGIIGMLVYLFLIILWVLVPFFIFLISKRVKEMRDMAKDTRIDIKELNANLKYLKRKRNELDEENL